MMVMSMNDCEMILEFPVVITGVRRSMKGGYLIKSFIAQFQSGNTTIDLEIDERDPRFSIIEEHLKSKGVINV